MARIGFTDGGFEIYVNTDDGGNIPHFHYRKGKYPNFTNHTGIYPQVIVYLEMPKVKDWTKSLKEV